MAVTIDISDDWQIFDNTQTVSYTSPAAVTTSNLTALKETLSQTPHVQGGMTVHTIRCRWHLFVENIGSVIPEENGYITDADSTKHYIHGNPELASWDQRYVVETTAQANATLQGSL